MARPVVSGWPARMKITVVVPVRNEESSIYSLLSGLRQQTRPPDEVIIVDGGSTDATSTIVETEINSTSNLRLIRETKALPGRGRNVGARAAANEWLAFIESIEYRQRFFGSSTGNQIAPPDDGTMARIKHMGRTVLRFALFGIAT